MSPRLFTTVLAHPSRSAPGRRRAKFQSALRLLTFFLFTALALATTAVAQQDLTQLSLEDLMNTKVTSVSKKEQSLSRTASAISVITSADIRRSGATNIPDLLRMAPGVDVAQIDANTWAISVRGLNGRFSNEVLVMLDGRNVYTPTFGGAFWDVLDLPLEDIERIEVIRGPGATIWGANAVNGVINIITRKAAETRGGMVVAGAGNLDQGFGTVQYGGGLGKSTDYRVYTKYFNQDHMAGLTGQDGGDGWHLLRGGFRSDSRLSTKDTLMVKATFTQARRVSRRRLFRQLRRQESRRWIVRFPYRAVFFTRSGTTFFPRGPIHLSEFLSIVTSATMNSWSNEGHSTLNFSTTSPGAHGRTLFGERTTAIPTQTRTAIRNSR